MAGPILPPYPRRRLTLHRSPHHGPNTNTNSISKPRRRSRASRKAPTTLLNASTANFRDLVQQFTGFQAAGAALPLGSHKGRSTSASGRLEMITSITTTPLLCSLSPTPAFFSSDSLRRSTASQPAGK